MEIYLIRHTKPDIVTGTCYGQADLDVVSSFEDEANCIRPYLPAGIEAVYSSPLKRCRQLAEHLFPGQRIQFDDRIKEIDCGEWELKLWDSIDAHLLKNWMADFVNVRTPGGESYNDLLQRTLHFFDELPAYNKLAIVAHGGVLRSILSHITQVELKESFNVFKLYYGCVIKLEKRNGSFFHTVLHNPPVEREQHRPTMY